MASSTSENSLPASEFDIWSQVPMETDHPSPPLFDLNAICRLSLEKEPLPEKLVEVQIKQEPLPETSDETHEQCFSNTCVDCGASELNSKISQYLHMHLKHNQFMCLFCQAFFNHVRDLADHLMCNHGIEERSLQPAQGQLSFDTQSYFICTECSAVVHVLDLQKHSLDCNAKPLFPVEDGVEMLDQELKASETLSVKLRAEEVAIQQDIFSLQSNIDWMKKMQQQLAVKLGKMKNTNGFKQRRTMKHLIGELTAMKYRLTKSLKESEQSLRGPASGPRKHLEKVCIQLKAVQKAYAKIEKNVQHVGMRVEALESQMQFLLEETKKKTLKLISLKERMAKVRMHREIEDLEKERASLSSP